MKTVEAEPGECLTNLIIRAKEEAQYRQETVRGVHNGITVDVHLSSNLRDIATIFELRRQLKRYEEGYVR
jgi:hypothetical protein